jgi:hypothetical protein
MVVSANWQRGDRAAAWNDLWRRILFNVLSGDGRSTSSQSFADGSDERAQEQPA